MNLHDTRKATEQLQKGIIQHRSGQIGLAQSHYQRAAKLDPQNPEAWQLLGVCALQMNNLPLAAKHLRTSTRLSPGFAEAHNNLGVALRRMSRHTDAIVSFRAALGARERYVEAAFNLGLALQGTDQFDEAERIYRQAIAWRPNDIACTRSLGNLLRLRGRIDEALPLLELVRTLQPDDASANGNYATLLIDAGRAKEALVPARAATTLDAQKAMWWAALGLAERMHHNSAGAIAALRRAIELEPGDWTSLAELGLALIEAGDIGEARAILGRTGWDPRHAERLRWTHALSLPSVYADQADVDTEHARFENGLAELSSGLRLDTVQEKFFAYEAASSVSIFQLLYQGRNNSRLQIRFGDLIHRVLGAGVPQLMQPLAWRPRAHGGRVRVGVVSSHLMNHTVSRYFRSLIAGLDPSRFEVRVWYSGSVRDASTDAIAAQVASFEFVNEDAVQTAGRIRAAQLDALVYPEIGMDPRHQVLAALRLAPVQCVLYGHPATSGLPNMDHFISANALEPTDARAHYRENLVLLPGLGACPERPAPPGDGSWLDQHSGGLPLAMCLQNHLKLVPAFDNVLARIAQRSGTRIGFFERNSGVAKRFRERIEAAFASHGIDPQQALVFLPSQGYGAYLGGVARAALVLDSPWFSGGATSLDAFSVGTPVLTWDGQMARGRQTLGMLKVMGVEGLIASDPSDYIEMATSLLGDAELTAALRNQILQRNGRLFAGTGVIAAFEHFLDQATLAAVASPP